MKLLEYTLYFVLFFIGLAFGAGLLWLMALSLVIIGLVKNKMQCEQNFDRLVTNYKQLEHNFDRLVKHVDMLTCPECNKGNHDEDNHPQQQDL